MENVALAFIHVSDTNLGSREVLAGVETRIGADKQHQSWQSPMLVKGHSIHQTVAHHDTVHHREEDQGQHVPQQPMVHRLQEDKQVCIRSRAIHTFKQKCKVMRISGISLSGYF